MKVDLFLVKDNDGNILNNFQSLHTAQEFAKYSKGIVERIMITSPNKREVDPQVALNKKYAQYNDKTLFEMENHYVLHILNEVCGGNKTHAAHVLGISVKGLYNKLEKIRGTVNA